MKLADAAAQFIKATRLLKDAERDRDEAKAVLLEHFRKAKRNQIHGVEYSKTPYRRLDTKKARELLGDRAADAEVKTYRETISPIG